jgi:hypothetical protein
MAMADQQRLLELALKGLEAERAQIESQLAQLTGRRGTRVTTSGSRLESRTPTGRKRRRMSAEAKRKISEAMKRRYAELRKAVRKAA